MRPPAPDSQPTLLDALLDSWDRSNVILLNPILLLQHMLWHEGYHHGQIKLALKMAGCPLSDDEAGPLTWRVWMNKRDASHES